MSFLKKITIVLLLSPVVAFSQIIKGKVKDNVEVIPWANVVLTDTNNKLISGTTTDDNGAFEIKTKNGQYTLTISFVGYADFKKEINLTNVIDLGDIILKENSNQLDEVIVKAKKKLFERKADRMVFNVANNIASVGSDALQTLKITPGLVVSNNTIELLGKGASRVMINGRLVNLSGEELVNYISSIASDDIQKIEVITNPPAKYEASGNGGLINIILKKGVLNSWKNSTTLSYSKQYFQYGTLRNNFFYNKDKVQFSASVNATKGNIRNLENVFIEYPVNPAKIAINSKENKDAYSARVSFDYNISDNISVGALYLGGKRNPGNVATAKTSVLDMNNNTVSYSLNEGEDNRDAINHSVNIHTTIKLDTLGRSVSFDADYFQYNADNSLSFITNAFDDDDNFLGLSSTAISKSNQIIDNYSVRADVIHPFKRLQLGYGGKYTTTKSNSNLSYFDRISGSPQLDPSRSNTFDYKEDNTALYVSATKQFNDKWTAKAGLRLEHTSTNGFSKSLNQRNKKDYTKLFPTLYVTYKSNERNLFGASYGRRIQRPGFSLLNPFRSYVREDSYSEGNPFLQPSFSDNIELFHSYKNKLNTNISLSITTDGFGVVFKSDPETQTQIVTQKNYFSQYQYSISESYLFSNSWLQSQNSVYLVGYKTTFRDEFNAVPKNGMQFYVSTNNTFSLSENSKIQLNSWYASAHNRGLYSVNEMFNLSVGYQQSFLNKNLQASIMMNDIFNTSRLTDYTSNVNGINQIYGQDNGTRNLTVTLTYNFGNNKIKTKNTTFGNNDEQDRVN